MELKGMVMDQQTGNPLPGVTVWEISADGRSANVLGYSDKSGNYDVMLSDPQSDVNFILDGYTGTNIQGTQAQTIDAVLLSPLPVPATKNKLSAIPAWAWWIVAGAGIYYLSKNYK